MGKRFVLVFLIIIAVSCSTTSWAKDQMEMSLAHVMSTSHPYHLASNKFKEVVEERTDGRISITIFPGGQLGRQRDLAEMVAAGQVDFCLVWPGTLESYDPDLGVISFPFLFRDKEHLLKVINSDLAKDLFLPLESKGLKVLTAFYNGTYNILSKKTIRYPEDMRGIKLRVPPSALFVEMAKLLGSVVITTDFTEVPSAFQTGGIDAEIQSSINIKEARHYEFAGYLCRVKLAFLVEPFLMSLKRFNQLERRDQEIILDAAQEAALYQIEKTEEREFLSDIYLRNHGVEYFTPYYKTEWVQAVSSLYKNHPEWDSLFEKINAVP
ncbi:MAG: TRAP transporter substrate-binding protein [Synergistales bacterium]|nr:TRAP transporter substrate-binding protein [Synergistales bacterium]